MSMIRPVLSEKSREDISVSGSPCHMIQGSAERESLERIFIPAAELETLHLD